MKRSHVGVRGRRCARLLISGLVLILAAGCSQSDPSSPISAVSTAGATPAEDQTPIVAVRTTMGDLKIRMFPDKAPRTVVNFMNYANSGHYDRTIFHQVEPEYALLGGGYQSDLKEKAGRYPIPCEANNGLKNRRGTIAMARDLNDPDSATCQFIINLGDNPSFDYRGDSAAEHGFCVFGEVIEGLDVLDRIAQSPVEDRDGFHNVPKQAVQITQARRIR